MNDKEYVKGLFEGINIRDQIISKYEELTNDYKHEIERLNNEYSKAFERLKSQQREIDRLKEENERFENNMKSVLEIEKKQSVKEFAEKLKMVALILLSIGQKFTTEKEIDKLLKEYEK